MTLTSVMTLKGHKGFIRSMAYFPDGKRIISVSYDKTIRQWDLQAGKEIEEVQDVYEGEIYEVVVSRDCRWIMTLVGDGEHCELKAYEVETGIVKTLQDSQGITCIDISTDGKLLAGESFDRTVLIWGMDTGERVAGPFKSRDKVAAVRFSPDSKKLAVESNCRRRLEVWDVQTQELDAQVGKKGCDYCINAPIFWTKKGTILAEFKFTFEDYGNREATAIYEFNASTLETVGDPFEGERSIRDLALSFDGTLLASSSIDTIKLWDFEPRQLLASFHVQHHSMWISDLTFSSDARQLAYSVYNAICICNTPPDILAGIRVAPDAQAVVRICCKYLIVDVLISSSRSVHLTIQPSTSYSMCSPHCSIHLHY